ncbi:carbamoyl-phosphate synthase small chain [Oxobacter pfennigii]|uniref:Carbamoyl phosphate synthase small chain n=1 Tax=Oxobacter pfennigii TaxID=36849 RepID=A0A0N8NSL0_9CLOT|nr:carbamoyl phosphate synthase small subunit [Oxobacter pfennigii]KPU42328.1 carbamoyl-phosphate synthase small chain [Oxobacter pfennigii]
MKGYLLLEDGNIFEGKLLNDFDTIGEVVFNTSMTGYQEVLTDPSYYGQIVVMTYPQIGNYGLNSEFSQSEKPHVKGFVVRHISDIESNCKSEDSLKNFLNESNIPMIYDIDTRHVVKLIREKGVMMGAIVKNFDDIENLKEKIQNYTIVNAVESVTAKDIHTIGSGKYHVGLMDYGYKQHILKNLLDRDCKVTVFPSNTSADEILKYNLDGLMLSNGPGDPKENNFPIEQIRKLIGKFPIFGICLGHQLTAIACGADTHKLKYGHRGGNHPVKDLTKDKCFMTSQNHGYAVDSESLNDDMEVTHINLNDNTIEGIRYKNHDTFTVQFHPEAHAGPQDTAYLFDEFISKLEVRK